MSSHLAAADAADARAEDAKKKAQSLRDQLAALQSQLAATELEADEEAATAAQLREGLTPSLDAAARARTQAEHIFEALRSDDTLEYSPRGPLKYGSRRRRGCDVYIPWSRGGGRRRDVDIPWSRGGDGAAATWT